MPHCIKAAKRRSRATSGTLPRLGYHLIIYGFRSINHLINNNTADLQM